MWWCTSVYISNQLSRVCFAFLHACTYSSFLIKPAGIKRKKKERKKNMFTRLMTIPHCPLSKSQFLLLLASLVVARLCTVTRVSKRLNRKEKEREKNVKEKEKNIQQSRGSMEIRLFFLCCYRVLLFVRWSVNVNEGDISSLSSSWGILLLAGWQAVPL